MLSDISNKIVFISPLEMLSTKITTSMLLATKAGTKSFFGLAKTKDNSHNIYYRVTCPFGWMILFYVFIISFIEFKVFDSIVCFISIYMMNTFFCFQLSTKIFFHYMAMLKNSFVIYIYTKIAKFCKTRLSFFKIFPVWRNEIIISVPKETCPVHWTYMSIVFFENLITTFNFAYITNHISNYNRKDNICQI